MSGRFTTPVLDSKLSNIFCSNINLSLDKTHMWIVDSGANQHMITNYEHVFNSLDVSDLNLSVKHPNGTHAQIMKIGNLKIADGLVLKDVMVIPDYCVNLISVNKMAKDNKLYSLFTESHCYVQDLFNRKLVMIGKEVCGLYAVSPSFVGKTNNFAVSNSASHLLWHSRLGHPSDQVLQVLKQDLGFSENVNTQPCEVCHKSKQTRTTFVNSEHKTYKVGDLIHLDVWGPFKWLVVKALKVS
jgi:hypothetical protein